MASIGSPVIGSPVRGNVGLSFVCGLVGSVFGAVAWAFISSFLGYDASFMALVVGSLVGSTIHSASGSGPIFGIMGGGFAALGCLIGETFSTPPYTGDPWAAFALLSHSDLVSTAAKIVGGASIATWVFTGIAVCFAYQFSMRSQS